LAPEDVVQALLRSNVIVPAGSIRIGTVEYDVTMNNSPRTIAEFDDIPVKVAKGPRCGWATWLRSTMGSQFKTTSYA
jgi:multidrug efflux pump subunit AcrB